MNSWPHEPGQESYEFGTTRGGVDGGLDVPSPVAAQILASATNGVHLGVQNTRRSRSSSESSEKKTAAGPKRVGLPPFPLSF